MNTHFLSGNSVKQLTMDMPPSRKLKVPCQNATMKYINGQLVVTPGNIKRK